MSQINTTKLSSRGQIVIPEDIRKSMQLHSGDQFLVLAEDDVIILKTISQPHMDDFTPIIKKIRKTAKESGLTSDDIDFAIKMSRKK